MSIYAVILLLYFFTIFILSQTRLANNRRFFIVLVTVSISILGMFFNPEHALKNGDYTDLIRFYSDIEAFRKWGWNVSADYLNTNYLLIPFAKLIVYICAIVGKNNLIQLISGIMIYGFFGITLCTVAENEKIEDKKVVKTFIAFILLYNFASGITNIRMPIGLSIFFYILINDLGKKWKFKFCMIGYIVTILLHPIFILILCLRFLLVTFKKFSKIFTYIILIFSSVIISFIMSKFGLLGDNEVSGELLWKYQYYVSSNNVTQYEIYPTFFSIIQICVLGYFLLITRKFINEKSSLKDIYNVSIIYLLFAIGSFWNYHLFVRMSNFLIYFIVYWNMICYKIKRKDTNQKTMIMMYDMFFYILILSKLLYYFSSYQYNILTF